MRLWYYKLIPVLPDKMLVSQWRECIAIKRQWEKGTLKHRLVNYVMNYDKKYFMVYVGLLVNELANRNIKFKMQYLDEISKFCDCSLFINFNYTYPEHYDRYLRQCYYNLQEKYDRGIITKEEWKKIENLVGDEI